MALFEKNPQFSNPLVGASSPYLKQHAHNPVFWYPWGPEAHVRALTENKPILLSIGYSACHWCHVMERDVFENVSIAAMMNQNFINIKLDREEHPYLDEIYMVARQLITQEGGWPNNVFLTPDLKPFFAGGTYGPDDSFGKPAFPRLLEWLNYAWTTQEKEVRDTADKITADMRPHLQFTPQEGGSPVSAKERAGQLFNVLKQYYDARSGGFFQAPKFPRECFLSFLLAYYGDTNEVEALDMVANTIGKMASGGIYDQVACGFHRYAVDKEWYVPHFEKMLYTQAQMARVCLDTARLTRNSYFADTAKGVLDFVSGPMTSPDGAFYAAIDAESEGIEGQYYAWESKELESILLPEEVNFFVEFFALADIPAFPGHKHPKGQVIIARKPIYQAARTQKMPYVHLAAMVGTLMNKLLSTRNLRSAPALDNKIIVSWNGLMIDAYAHAGMVFGNDRYTKIAKRAADYLLANACDSQGYLVHTLASGKPDIAGMLEDSACFIKGLLTLLHASPDPALLPKIESFVLRAEFLFADPDKPGFFNIPEPERALFRTKNADDSMLPNANALMLDNYVQLYGVTRNKEYLEKAQKMAEYFLQGSDRALSDIATMVQSALLLDQFAQDKKPAMPTTFTASDVSQMPGQVARVSARLLPEDARPGDDCELVVTLKIQDGWHVNANKVTLPHLIPTQLDVQGEGVELLEVQYPQPLQRHDHETGEALPSYHGEVTFTAKLRLADGGKKRPEIKVLLRFQPCTATLCHEVRDISLVLP